MKEAAKAVIRRAVRHRATWSVLRGLHTLGFYAAVQRAEFERGQSPAEDPAAELAARVSPSLAVMNGPFRGMRYREARAAGSLVLPKLVGCYEAELHPLLEELLGSIAYRTVVNIGCAEGFYAVGLALRLPQARVLAFDTDVRALDSCRLMAELNGVAARVELFAECTHGLLMERAFEGPALFVVDCEGCEAVLFDEEVAHRHAGQDFLIEVHDFVDIGISDHLRQAFGNTHELRVVSSVDDLDKARQYRFAQLEGLDLHTRLQLVREGRPGRMEWFFLRSRSR